MNTDKVALVTGAQRGIGRAIALKAAALGYAVAVNHAEQREEAEAVVAAIRDSGGTAMLAPGDLGDVASIQAMVAAVDNAWGRIDALVNNAGIFPRVPFLEMREQDWDPVLDINLKGSCFAAIAVARVMIRQGIAGSIVNMASSAIRGGPRAVHYAASKGGIVAMTRGMAVELAPHRIRVNAVAPGLTNTLQPRQGMSEDEVIERSASLPLGRMAEPEEIAEAVAFLMGGAASMITGQTLHVNSGDYRP